MDREHLTRLIDDPARVQREDIADLKAMAERYPWFSGAHLLLAVGGHREGDVLFDEQLRASAAHLPSRAVLFDKLHVPEPFAHVPVPPSAPERPQTVPEPAPMTEVAQLVEEPAQVDEPTVPEPVVLAPVPLIPPPETTSPEPPLPKHIPTPWKERLLRGDRDEEALDRQMRDSAVAISYELLLEREGLLEPQAETPVPPEQAEPLVAVPDEPEMQVVPEPPQQAKPAARSFADWLSEDSPKAPSAAATKPAPHAAQRSPVARPVEDPEIIRAVQQLPPLEPKHTPETAETKALVERFIKQNAEQTQQPKKAEFFNPQTAAKRSLEEHADLVTETLARIYEKQGNIAKAIAAYERLAVKHPEKSAHFRALAKALSGR